MTDRIYAIGGLRFRDLSATTTVVRFDWIDTLAFVQEDRCSLDV